MDKVKKSYGLKNLAGILFLLSLVFMQTGCFSDNNNSTTVTTNNNVNAVAKPTFNIPAGFYNTAQSIIIATTTSGASLRYTIDGSDPTINTGNVYNAAVSIPLPSVNLTLKAIAYKDNTTSEITTAVYTIENVVPTFTVQYYSDANLTNVLNDNSILGGVGSGNSKFYYLKITSNEELKNPPTVTIDAQGTANDIPSISNSNLSTVVTAGTVYRLSRVIQEDGVNTDGSVLETIKITGTDLAGNVSTDAIPLNAALKCAYINVTKPANISNHDPALNDLIVANISAFRVNADNNAAGNKAGKIYVRLEDSLTSAKRVDDNGTDVAAGAVNISCGAFSNNALDIFSSGETIRVYAYIVDSYGNWSSFSDFGTIKKQ